MPTTAIATSGWADARIIGSSSGIHGSLDFANQLGDPIYAVADGMVVRAERGSGETGNYVLIKHTFKGSLTILSRYIHLDDFVVVPGQSVRRGQLIGHAGNSGISGAVHLHLDIHVCGEAALLDYKRVFGWPTTTLRPLIKNTLPDCYLVPAEPLVEVAGYRARVVDQALTYGLALFRDRTDWPAKTMPTAVKVLIVLGLIGTAAGAGYYGWTAWKRKASESDRTLYVRTG